MRASRQLEQLNQPEHLLKEAFPKLGQESRYRPYPLKLPRALHLRLQNRQLI
jgi:hypothetical protein